MKRLLAKTLTSTALVLMTFTAAQAEGPPLRLFSPEELQYWEKHEAILAKEVRGEAKDRNHNTLRPSYLPWAQRVSTPEQLQYWAGREPALAKELRDKPMKEPAMQWLQHQPQKID